MDCRVGLGSYSRRSIFSWPAESARRKCLADRDLYGPFGFGGPRKSYLVPPAFMSACNVLRPVSKTASFAFWCSGFNRST